ncbi:hypothetical protein H5410_043200 [Solanum commersonii]|uniref:Uncharacterized protein n=1 Tax=Solanum commersonii TaxID=4109 RepID=A0A9J5Y0Q9_SOLCO|nr:hypothetical protein H5410_043200 [Solanum commersonii]
MACFPIPRGVERKIEKLRRDFLWNGCEEKKNKYKLWSERRTKIGSGQVIFKRKRRKTNLLRWDSLICSKKNHGGLESKDRVFITIVCNKSGYGGS